MILTVVDDDVDTQYRGGCRCEGLCDFGYGEFS